MMKLFILAVVITICAAGNVEVYEKCLKCICEAASGCNQQAYCSGTICGPYSLTWAYWADAGGPNLKVEGIADFATCANNHQCAASAVKSYMQRHQQDCNGDGKIDCDDYLAIHFLGPYGCRAPIPEPQWMRYQQCKAHSGGIL